MIVSVLLSKTLVPCKFSKDKILIGVPLIFLNKQVIRRSQRVVLIHLYLSNKLVNSLKTLDLGV
jgi:hypothetical protein